MGFSREEHAGKNMDEEFKNNRQKDFSIDFVNVQQHYLIDDAPNSVLDLWWKLWYSCLETWIRRD